MITIITKSAAETGDLGRALGKILKPNDVVALSGELGSGKTTFIQGLASGLGIEDFVSSPSFTIINEYYGNIPLYHVDLYRLEEIDDIEALGIEEYFGRGGVVAVEWAERMKGLIPRKHMDVTFEPAGENERKIKIEPLGQRIDLSRLTGGG